MALLEMKTAMFKLKNTLGGIKRGLDTAEETIS